MKRNLVSRGERVKELRAAHADASHAPETEAHLLFAALAIGAATPCIILPSILLGLVKRSSVIEDMPQTADARAPGFRRHTTQPG